MKKLLFGICFLMTAVLLAQEKKMHLLSLENEKNAAIESDFYIDKVYDGRQVKENIGTVYVSVFNSKVSANFKKPFTEELQSLFSVLYPKSENKKAISIRVDELYVTENRVEKESYNNDQRGTAVVVIDIIEKNTDGKEFIIGTFFSSKEEIRSDITRKHPELITAALKNSFENYKNTKDTYKVAIPFADEDSPLTIPSDSKIPAGIYLNYRDVFSGKFLNIDDYTITKYKEGFCLLNNESGRVENGFYGFSDGQHFYLNLFQFSNVKYYLKAELMANNYFINEVEENNIDFNSYALSYGAVIAMGGGLIPAMLLTKPDDAEVKKIPMTIDRITGTPTFLTDKYVLQILESNPVLLKEYKKTKRTPADKKAFYKRLYNLE